MLKTKYFSWTLAFLLLFSTSVQANLMISPTRVVFDDRDRSQSVYIINNSNETKTYRFSFLDQRQIANGDYQSIKDEGFNAGLMLAKDMIRFSPRQVTLKPNESQMIKLSLRKAANLNPGEYRTHLSFTALPAPQKLSQQEGSAGIQLFMSLGFTIPVMVRQGAVEVSNNLSNLRLIPSDNGETVTVLVDIERSGKNSSFGKLSVLWRPTASVAYQELGFVNNIAVYPEVDKRLNVGVTLPSELVKPGLYKILYEGEPKHFGKKIFGELEASVQ